MYEPLAARHITHLFPQLHRIRGSEPLRCSILMMQEWRSVWGFMQAFLDGAGEQGVLLASLGTVAKLGAALCCSFRDSNDAS